MSRPYRLQAPNTLYHVTTNSTDRWNLFVTDRDRMHFIDLLAGAIARHEFTCLAFCLMDTHYHLLLRTKHANIAAGMQELNSRYAQAFNMRHERPGCLVRARYGSTVVEGDGHLLWCIRYVARNPVEAGMCRSPSDWRFSSYPGLVGDGPRWPFVADDEVLALFSSDRETAIARVRDFVEGAPAAVEAA